MKNRSRRGIVASLAAAAAGVTMVALPLGATPAAAGSPPQGAAWLASQLSAKGVIPNGGGSGADYGATVQSVLALMQAGYSTKRIRAAVPYLANNLNKYAQDTSGRKPVDKAASLAVLLKLATVSGASSFHPAQLVKRLLKSQQSTGLFGKTDSTYDGTYRQSLALEALVDAGVASSNQDAMAAGLAWLVAQQCPDGGFASDASSLWVGCVSDPSNWLGPDSNSTAQAIIALVALGQPSGPGSPLARAIANLESTEQDSGSWSYFPDQTPDSNSTALAVQALATAGVDVWTSSGPAAPGGIAPLDGLLSFIEPSSGGFRFEIDPSFPTADVYSTYQALLALDALAGIPHS